MSNPVISVHPAAGKPAATRVIIVGLGHHGLLLASQIVERGYDLVGAVEVNDLVGQPLSAIVPGAKEGAIVHASPAEASGTLPDVAVLAATVPTTVAVELARELLAAGVNVVALPAELFDPEQSWQPELDALGKKTGATLLATGVQDTWWVHMPALAAGSSSNISRIAVEHVVDVNTLSMDVASFLGIGRPPDATSASGPQPYVAGEGEAVLGAALQEAARLIGLTPTCTTLSAEPVLAGEPVRWTAGNRTIMPGRIIGTKERTLIETAQGVALEGTLHTVILTDDQQPSDRLTIDGTPRLVLEHRPFPGEQITNIAVLNRIPDVIVAPGGVMGASQLPAARPWLGLTRRAH
ncbi:hypothetical protein AB0F17_53915 [Nonomuraea sp. NPDC026600]|uniref:hypothetical protein n=1 Tax=Nonomuraea sp. NPDC026600 TaxID=3155363 RepID=UPI0033D6DCB8